MLNIFYGREDTDKNLFIYDNLKENTILIVPDQYTLEAEKDLLKRTERTGLLDIEILSFSRLSERILSQCGSPTGKPVNKYGRYMLLLNLLEDSQGRLAVYRNIALKPSFVEMVNDFIAQLRQNNIDSAALYSIKEGLKEGSLLKEKLNDICIIYEQYEEAVSDKYIDTEDELAFVISKIKESEFLKDKRIWIYCFDSFTPKNMEYINELIHNTSEVNIVLTYDKSCPDSHLFELTGSLISKFESLAGSECKVEKISGYEVTRPAGLKALEKNLYAFPPAISKDSSGINILSASGIYQEVESAASYICSLVRDKNYRYSDIAVICNDLENLGDIIRRTFLKYDIPVFVDDNKGIFGNSLCIHFVSILNMAVYGINTSDVFKMLRSGYSGYGLEHIDELDNYVHEFKIEKRGWKSPFTRIGTRSEEVFSTCESMRKEIYEYIDTLSSSLQKAETVSEKVKVICSYYAENEKNIERIRAEKERLEEYGYSEEAQLSILSLNTIVSILEQIDEILGDETISTQKFNDIISSGLSEAKTGVLPPVCDSINLGTAQRTRIASAKAVIVLGADEGVFPENASSNMLLSDDELGSIEKELQVTVARRQSVQRNEEALGVYRILSLPSEVLWIGTAVSDENGDLVKPSPVINTVLGIFENLEVSKDIFSEDKKIERINSSKATSDNIVRSIKEYLDTSSIDDIWKEAICWYKENDIESLNRIKSGFSYSPVKNPVGHETARDLYMKDGKAFSFSPSQLETFARCPFEHFINYGLKPQERKVYEMKAREIGDVYHEIFMEMSKKLTLKDIPLTDEASPWVKISYDDFSQMMKNITGEIFSKYKDGLMINGPVEAFRSERLSEIATYIGWILVYHVRSGKIKESFFEAGFGRKADIPPIIVNTETDDVYIEGIIDRLDILGNDKVKVIDYKTGKADFSKGEAIAGWKLQLMIYLKAGMNYKFEREPAGAFYFHVSDKLVDLKSINGAVSEEAINQQLLSKFRLDGAVINDPEIIEKIAGSIEAGSSPILPVRASKSGYSATSRSKVFEESEFNELLEKVDETIKSICSGIVAGNISLEPKMNMKQKASACHYCKFKSICTFETSFDELNYSYF